MPSISVNLTEGEEAEFGEALVEACARQMLNDYFYMDQDSEGFKVEKSSLARQIQNKVVEVVREEARAAAPGIVAKMLSGEVRQSDKYGHWNGETMTVEDVVVDELKKQVSPRRGSVTQDCVFDALIREVARDKIEGEMRETLAEAKRVIVNAMTQNAVEALKRAVSAGVPLP